MNARPSPPDVDRAAASRAAIAARRARAAVKSDIAAGTRTALSVARAGWADPAGVEAGIRVTELLTSVPGVGVARAQKALDSLTISEKKRISGLGSRQRERLAEYLGHKPGEGPNRLLVLAGPTAVGKGSVSTYIRDHFPNVMLSVSATTRPPRPGEIDGVHYVFVSDQSFDRLIDDGELLEWAQVHNSYRYGTPRTPIDEALSDGRRVMLEIDLQGARQVRSSMANALLVFLLPPSWEELVRRLIGRATENNEEQQRRLETAKVELAAQDEFDERVVNTTVEQAAREVVELMDVPAGTKTFGR